MDGVTYAILLDLIAAVAEIVIEKSRLHVW